MAEKRISVRLAAVGGRQVRAELEGIGAAGTKGFGRLSSEMERANTRLAGFATKAGIALAAMTAAAAAAGVERLLLFGYHGKLLKLAGGIFHTHHHLADGRAEVLTALAALEGLQGEALHKLWEAATVEQAMVQLELQQPLLAQRLRRWRGWRFF